MSYQETIKYLETFINYEKIPVYSYKESLKLGRIKGFLNAIANPQEALRCIHVSGSKGKGSTCAFISYILREAGYKTGLYTSPHLSDFRERIRVLVPRLRLRASGSAPEAPNLDFEGMIPQRDLTELVERLKPAIDKYNKFSKYGALSFFEVYTAIAFMYFKEREVDFAVLETGLGGRLDATNTINPYVCAITPISHEHTQQLGNRLAQIAAEKAGIIKNRRPYSVFPRPLIIISAPQEKEAIAVIRKKCAETGAKLYELNKDIIYKKSRDAFTVKGVSAELPDLKVRLLGEHQILNASVAVAVAEALNSYGIKVGIDSIRSGLYKAAWPGRCEVVCRKPLIILDGAQNIASVRAIKAAVKENFDYERLILVLGVSRDKDIAGICDELRDLADEIILTRAVNSRALEPDLLAGYFQDKKIHLTDNVAQAQELAYRLAGGKALVLVTGSLFVVGEFRDAQKRYQ